MTNTSTLAERDAMVSSIITAIMQKHKLNNQRATNVFVGMVTVVLEQEQLEMLLKVALKEND